MKYFNSPSIGANSFSPGTSFGVPKGIWARSFQWLGKFHSFLPDHQSRDCNVAMKLQVLHLLNLSRLYIAAYLRTEATIQEMTPYKVEIVPEVLYNSLVFKKQDCSISILKLLIFSSVEAKDWAGTIFLNSSW